MALRVLASDGSRSPFLTARRTLLLAALAATLSCSGTNRLDGGADRTPGSLHTATTEAIASAHERTILAMLTPAAEDSVPCRLGAVSIEPQQIVLNYDCASNRVVLTLVHRPPIDGSAAPERRLALEAPAEAPVDLLRFVERTSLQHNRELVLAATETPLLMQRGPPADAVDARPAADDAAALLLVGGLLVAALLQFKLRHRLQPPSFWRRPVGRDWLALCASFCASLAIALSAYAQPPLFFDTATDLLVVRACEAAGLCAAHGSHASVDTMP